MRYYHRSIEQTLQTYLSSFPVVGLMGPRQSGKSTLLQHQLNKKYEYITFDHQPTIDLFYNDPEKFIRQHNHHVIFDEAQKAPEIFNAIKIAVDEDRQSCGKFIVTGSSQFSLVEKITESLAGRMGLLTLLPFQFQELPKKLIEQSVYCGGYPELVTRNYENIDLWYANYLTTYLEKDVRNLLNIGNLRDFSRFIQLLASNTSQLFNASSYAHDLGLAVNTIRRWVSILEASYMIFLLPPYFKNQGKRIVKSPKVYFYDTGLVTYLTRTNTKELYENGPMTGAIFENYIISEIYKRELLDPKPTQMSFYRTSHGVEIDLIISRGNVDELLEIKSGETFKPIMLNPIQSLLKKDDQAYLIYNGKSINYDNQIKIVNYKNYL